MSVYLSIDKKKEVITRIKEIDTTRRTLEDLEAQSKEADKLDPLTNPKGNGDEKGRGGGDNNDKSLTMIMVKDMLKLKCFEKKLIICDYERGMMRLSLEEYRVLESLYVKNKTVRVTSKELNMDRSTVHRKRDAALMKMIEEMTWL